MHQENGWQRFPTDGHVAVLRAVVVASLLAFAAYYVAISIHWPLINDSPIMHYVNFLMAHGLRPYSDITDMNMPGAYLTENWAMHLFGPGDLAWRFYEFFLLAVFSVAMIVIAAPRDWFAGFLAVGLFLIVHCGDGPRFAAEREEVIMVLLIAGYAALFLAIRHARPWIMLFFGLATALAGSIKPTFAPLGIMLLLFAAIILRRRRVAMAPYLIWTLAGFAVITALVLGFFVRYGVLSQFLFLLRVVTPSYVALGHPTYFKLLWEAYPRSLLPLLFGAALLALLRRPKLDWESAALLLGAAFGLLSYFAQQKGFVYHRYIWISFIFLLCGYEISEGLRRLGVQRILAAATLLYVAAVSLPHYTKMLKEGVSHSDYTIALTQDLTLLGSGRPDETLQRKVLCFDLISGCLNSLYHLRVVENSGFTGDLLFFKQPETPPVRFYHDLFWERARRDPPAVLVISGERFDQSDSFDKLDAWPQFKDFLRTDYTEVLARAFFGEGLSTPRTDNTHPRAYRIYIRNDSPLLPQARAIWR